MIKINVKKGETYAVTSSTGCTLTYEKDGQMRILGSAEAGTQVGFVAPAEVVYCDDDTVDVTLFNGALASQAGRGGGSSSGGGLSSAERLMLTGAAQRDSANTFTASNTFTGSVDMSGAQVTPPEGWNVEGVTAEQVQAVVPMAFGAWTSPPLAVTNGGIAIGASAKASLHQGIAVGVGANGGYQSISIGADAKAPHYGVAISEAASAGSYGVSIGLLATSVNYAIAIGRLGNAKHSTSVTIGSAFEDTEGSHTCTTEGTGSITIGAGANTLNNGDVESSNSITIGCKAENKGADSVVIGAQSVNNHHSNVLIGASSQSTSISTTAVGFNSEGGYLGVSVGKDSKTATQGVALGSSAKAEGQGGVSIGWASRVKAKWATAIGSYATVSDLGATVIRSTAEDGTYTQLYFAGANTPLANTYHGGAPMLGYVTKDSAGNIVAAGTRSLVDLLTDNSTFAPASLDENGEWVMPKVFHPSDLDMPQEEPSEPEDYTPLPVWPIVEPEIEEMQ